MRNICRRADVDASANLARVYRERRNGGVVVRLLATALLSFGSVVAGTTHAVKLGGNEFDTAFATKGEGWGTMSAKRPHKTRRIYMNGTPNPPDSEKGGSGKHGFVSQKNRQTQLQEVPMQPMQRAGTQGKDGGIYSKQKKSDSGKPKNGPLLHEAIDVCSAAYDEHGAYPSIYRQIFVARQTHYRSHHHPTDVAIRNKLGAYYFAAKHLVASPRILYCGEAGGLPQDMASFGRAYVVKPLEGYSARGVHVVKDGTDILKGKKITRKYLLSKWARDLPVLVEELIEDPEFPGRVPPDYKFFVFDGRAELAWFYDRNPDAKCMDFLDVSSPGWTRLDAFAHRDLRPCNRTSYLDGPSRGAMLRAVDTLASNAGGNWMRVDMYRSPAGPVLGEFTPFSSAGKAVGMDGCVLSYLFVRHAVAVGRNDDAATLDRIVNKKSMQLDASVPPLSKRKTLELKEVVRGWIPENFAMETVDHMNVDYSMVGWDQRKTLDQCNQTKEMQDTKFGKLTPEALGAN